MKLFLFIVESYPFPVNNGVTAAIGSFCRVLEHFGEIEFYCLDNQTLMYQENFLRTCELSKLDLSKYELILSSPLKASLAAIKISSHTNKNWSLLSDCYTYALIANIRLYFKFKTNYSKIPITLCKIVYYYIVEYIIARRSKYVFMQTPKDTNVFKLLFLKRNVISFPNMPNTIARKDTINKRNSFKVSYVASFEGGYLMIAKWFIDNVWRKVVKAEPRAKLHLVGSNRAAFKDMLDTEIQNSIIVEKYYEDLQLFYSDTNLAVAPIFKGYGLINKTVEAMQNGCIVIGDKAAFNGIQYAENEKSCVIVESAEDFVNSILKYINNDNYDMRQKAIEAIINSFNINKSKVILDKLI